MMPVCKFFLRGACNRGDSCRFDHIFPDEDSRSGGAGYDDSRGTSVLKRDSSSYESGSGYSDQTYYNEPKNYNVYKKYNDRNTQNQSASYYNDYPQSSRNYNERSVQNNFVTIDNDFYPSSPIKQNDPQQYYGSQKYSNDRYHFDSRQSKHQQYQVSQKAPEISIDELCVLLKSDINFIEKGRSWPLTSYCIVKLFGSLEDWYDYSPEELRLAAYIAKASNNFEGFKVTIDKIVAQSEAVRDFYKNISKDVSDKLRAYIKQSPATTYPLMSNELDFTRINYSSISLSPNTNDFGNMQPSTVGEPFQQPTEDAEMSHSPMAALDFGSVGNSKPSANIFGGFQQQNSPTNVFGSSSQVQETLNSNVFGSTPNDQPSFGLLIDNANSFSSRQTQGTVSGSQYNFSIPQGPKDLEAIYPNLKGTDLDLEILSLMWRGDSPFSIRDELTEEELEQFKASAFTSGKVPMIPPPKELC